MTHQIIPKAGVMGWPIEHSLSPRLHGYWLDYYNIKGDYTAIKVRPEDLRQALHGLRDQGFSGVNLTIPHKVSACQIVDELSDTARRIGAVNLVVVENNGRLVGHNTDAYGFEQNLMSCGFAARSDVAVVLGAGGACRAILMALGNMGLKTIRLANRTRLKAEALAQDFASEDMDIQIIDWDTAKDALDGATLVVNTTSLGMKGQPRLVLPLDKLCRSATVTDIVYSPLQTDLLVNAAQHGCRAIDGLGMLLHQARPSFKAFFGTDPTVTAELRDFVSQGFDQT